MQFYKKAVVTSLLLVIAQTGLTEENEAPKGVSGAAEFGMVLTSGNTDNSTTTGRFEISNDLEQWLHFAKLEVVTADVDGTSSAERYLLNLKSDYKLENDSFLFAGLTHEVDKFSGFDSQSTLVAGYGKKLYDTEIFLLSAEIGPGYRKSELENGDSESESILHLGAKSKYVINEASYLTSDLTIDRGSEQTVSILNLGYVNKLNSTLALKVSVNIKNSSDVPVGIEETDTITSVSLLYSF